MIDGRVQDAPLTMGDHCRWCPANNNCPALIREVNDMNPDLDPVVWNDDELGEAIMKLAQLGKLKERAETEAFKRGLAGRKVKFFKIVRKIATRVWKDGAEEAVKAALGTQAYTTPSLKTPPQIEAIQGGAKLVARWAMKPHTGLTLAPESDKRDAVSPDALSEVNNDGTLKEKPE
jgi:hypothetical protein